MMFNYGDSVTFVCKNGRQWKVKETIHRFLHYLIAGPASVFLHVWKPDRKFLLQPRLIVLLFTPAKHINTFANSETKRVIWVQLLSLSCFWCASAHRLQSLKHSLPLNCIQVPLFSPPLRSVLRALPVFALLAFCLFPEFHFSNKRDPKDLGLFIPAMVWLKGNSSTMPWKLSSAQILWVLLYPCPICTFSLLNHVLKPSCLINSVQRAFGFTFLILFSFLFYFQVVFAIFVFISFHSVVVSFSLV